jgi:hypothetical protein
MLLAGTRGSPMTRETILAAGRRMLAEARALRLAFPTPAALRATPLTPLAAAPGHEALRAALGYLWDEMVLVRDGKAGDLGVLDDEVAHAEGLLDRL